MNEHQMERDSIAEGLKSYAQKIVVVVFGLLPIFFIPTQLFPFEYTKIFFVLGGIVAALVLYSLSVLRSGTVSLSVSYPVVSLWVVALLSLVSTLLSGDFSDSFIGDTFSIHSTLFVGLLALVVSVWMLLDAQKVMVMRLYMLLSFSTVLLVVYHVLRLVFGFDVLTFNLFTGAVTTPVGAWNDLGLFLGLSVILSLVALEQLSLTKMGRLLFALVTAFAVVMLAVINFFTVWLVLGLTSLAVLVYTLSKDRFAGPQLTLVTSNSMNGASLTTSLAVFIISVFFIIGGSALGAFIAKHTGVSYIEVRPSFEATSNIIRSIYEENAFLGIGTNKFVDAWRLYKDQSINATVFWNTDFTAGNGYIPTFFATTGVLGGLSWLLFFALFLVQGIRMLLLSQDADRMWYFIGVSSFVGAAYIWGLSLVYVPGAVILMLGALCTGIALSASRVLTKSDRHPLVFTMNRRTGFIGTLAVIVVIVGSISTVYMLGRHYAAVYTFNQSIRAFETTGTFEQAQPFLVSAYTLSQNDMFARKLGEYQFARMNTMLQTPSPTEQDQKVFEQLVVDGVNIAQQATVNDPTESSNWALLGGIYSMLVSANIDGVYDKAVDALSRARDLNPKNPIPYLELAILDGRVQKFDSARAYIQTAIALRPNYAEAYLYLSQIDIATGNVDDAITSTISMISIEPQNPARYYQLGVLYASKDDAVNAIASFEKAISLDQNYANARYFLALAYASQNRIEEAQAQLVEVLRLNPGNEEITALIQSINEGKKLTVTPVMGEATPVDETNETLDDNGVVSTDTAPDSSLVVPVNTAPASEEGPVSGVNE